MSLVYWSLTYASAYRLGGIQHFQGFIVLRCLSIKDTSCVYFFASPASSKKSDFFVLEK